MKKGLKLLLGVLAIGFLSSIVGADGTEYQNIGYNAEIVNESALPVHKTVVIDTNKLGVNRFSAQITASTANVSSVTFYDGKQSTMQVTINSNVALSSAVAKATLTVSSNTALSPAKAVNYLYITSNTALSGTYAFNMITITSMSALENSTITFNDTHYREGIEWNVMSTSMATTINLSTALAVNPLVTITSAGVGGLDIITLRATNIGSLPNSFDLTSSTPAAMTVSYSSFTNGFDPAVFTVNGTSYTCGINWTEMSLATETAVNISTSVSNSLVTISYDIGGFVKKSTVVFTAITPGTAGNLYYLTSSTNAALTRSAASFFGGTDQSRAHFAINGSSFTEGTHWGMKTLSSETATSMAYAINRSSLTLGVKASAVGDVVFTTPIAIVRSSHGVITGTPELWGTTPNSWTLTVSTGALLSSGTFSGGRDRATLVVGGKQFRNGLEWKSDISAELLFSSHSIANLYTALKADTTVSALIRFSTSITGSSVLYATSVYMNRPYEFHTTTQGALALSSASAIDSNGGAIGYMQGGFDSDVSTITSLITKSNSFSAGLPVLYSSNTTTGLTGLTHQTTYYVKSPTKTSFYLSRTSTGAVASTTATIVSVGTYYTKFSTGGGSYTLAPWLFAGISSMTWQVSNDGVNYNMTPYSVAITSATSANSTTFWDMGDVNYRWLKLNIATPTVTGGGVDVKAYLNGKK